MALAMRFSNKKTHVKAAKECRRPVVEIRNTKSISITRVGVESDIYFPKVDLSKGLWLLFVTAAFVTKDHYIRIPEDEIGSDPDSRSEEASERAGPHGGLHR
ncbi:hypothetical protein PoB_005383200 [Plakobranchus ocellatus]|uniref:Uncharacterized protein n=1 Tax=Plakobranchus ocellatus TaxID=259542 RepID=A0AAV4C6X5_9GAST|nr:hypothetical protein PoB_005383200 [Plakobranchus ocellatus]